MDILTFVFAIPTALVLSVYVLMVIGEKVVMPILSKIFIRLDGKWWILFCKVCWFRYKFYPSHWFYIAIPKNTKKKFINIEITLDEEFKASDYDVRPALRELLRAMDDDSWGYYGGYGFTHPGIESLWMLSNFYRKIRQKDVGRSI